MVSLRIRVQKKGYILVIEGDDLICQLLQRWLREGGYTVAAGDLARLRQHGSNEPPPLLVILDLANPRSAGVLIRSVQAMHAAPIIGLSARFRRGLGTSRDAARRLGVCKLLPKPFTRDELLGTVREAIEDCA
jgi:DNA-binding response OmpR family regulator